ncbi:hypothetical protein M3A49_17040 [Paraburkholderia sp. CNPSo 3076]|nr:hypothetical protein [Paraburkholderia sp. CNPSo 3076]
MALSAFATSQAVALAAIAAAAVALVKGAAAGRCARRATHRLAPYNLPHRLSKSAKLAESAD